MIQIDATDRDTIEKSVEIATECMEEGESAEEKSKDTSET